MGYIMAMGCMGRAEYYGMGWDGRKVTVDTTVYAHWMMCMYDGWERSVQRGRDPLLSAAREVVCRR